MTTIDDLKNKMKRQEPVKITPTGEITTTDDPAPGTQLKAQRWY